MSEIEGKKHDGNQKNIVIEKKYQFFLIMTYEGKVIGLGDSEDDK